MSNDLNPHPDAAASLQRFQAQAASQPTVVSGTIQRPTHPELVTALAKNGHAILASLSATDAHAIHMVIGISGEAGELLDAVKKAAIYRKPLDIENVIEELGDIEFSLEGLRQGYGITRQQTLEANITKLQKRYGGRYSDQAAQLRTDKA